jgi:hypothetical protein
MIFGYKLVGGIISHQQYFYNIRFFYLRVIHMYVGIITPS